MLCFPAYSQETLTGFEEEDLPKLNEELRRDRRGIRDNGEDIDTIETTIADIGKVLISANDTTLDELDSKLVAGAGIALTENNDSGNETMTISAPTASKSNVIFDFYYSGVDGGGLGYWTQAASTYSTFSAAYVSTKWKKVAGVDTITFMAYHSKVSSSEYIELDVGGQKGEYSQIGGGTGLRWTTTSTAVDVSALTNGTIYDVTVKFANQAGGAAGRLYKFVAWGS